MPLETEQALEALLAKLPATVFQADDSLGWSYQFWQAPKKEEVQRQMKQAGTKVGADELPAVTQLFTEQYMVAFLLENALGGWWHSRHPRMKLPVEMPYLLLSAPRGKGQGEGGRRPASADFGTPAAGTFPAWPDTLAQFKLLDPCAGSGHFLVSAFHYLVPMRRATEKLSVRDAIDRVLADNLHGLELDARCVEIAAFALALAAWRYPDEKGKPSATARCRASTSPASASRRAARKPTGSNSPGATNGSKAAWLRSTPCSRKPRNSAA
jgi:hypothetical protein